MNEKQTYAHYPQSYAQKQCTVRRLLNQGFIIYSHCLCISCEEILR